MLPDWHYLAPLCHPTQWLYRSRDVSSSDTHQCEVSLSVIDHVVVWPITSTCLFYEDLRMFCFSISEFPFMYSISVCSVAWVLLLESVWSHSPVSVKLQIHSGKAQFCKATSLQKNYIHMNSMSITSWIAGWLYTVYKLMSFQSTQRHWKKVCQNMIEFRKQTLFNIKS